MNIANKTVLITGANRSIGLETAKQLSKKGCFIYLGSRDLEKGNAEIEAGRFITATDLKAKANKW